jgi:hypothetical protein
MDKKPKDRMEIVEFDNSDDSFLEQARTQLSALEISYPNTTASDAQLLAATSLTILCDSNACSLSRKLLSLTRLRHLVLKFTASCSDIQEREFADNMNKLTSLVSLRLESESESKYYSYFLDSDRKNFLRLFLCLPPSAHSVPTARFHTLVLTRKSTDDIQKHIFSFLESKHSLQMCSVCRKWNALLPVARKTFLAPENIPNSYLLKTLTKMTNLTHLSLEKVKNISFASLLVHLSQLQHLRLPEISDIRDYISNLTTLRILEVETLQQSDALPQSLTKLRVYNACDAILPVTLRALQLSLSDVGLHDELSTLIHLTKLTLWVGLECKSKVMSLLPKLTQLRHLTLGPRPQFGEEEGVSFNSLHFLSQLTNLESLLLALPTPNPHSLATLSRTLTRLVLYSYKSISFTIFSRLQRLGVCLQTRDFFSHLHYLPHVHTFEVLLPTIGLRVEMLYDLEPMTHITKLVFIGWKSPTLWFSNATWTTPCPTRLARLIYDAKVISWT